jgi:predicted PurR-regulated permease PerM
MTDHDATVVVPGPAVEQAPPAPAGDHRFPVLRPPSAAGLVASVATAGVLLLLFAVSSTLPVFIIALILAFLLDPVVTWLAKRRVPRGLATLISIAILALILITLSAVFVDTVVKEASTFIAGLPEAFASLEDWVRTSNMPAGLQADVLAWLDSVRLAAQAFDYTRLVEPILGGLIAVLGSFFTILVLPFFLFYVLAGRPTISRSIDDVLPEPWRADVQTVIWIALDSFGAYVRAEGLVATILGTMVFVSLMVLSVVVDPAFADVALLLAVIAAFSELIPNFGPWIAAIPAVLFSLTISPVAVLVTILLYTVLMFIEGQVLVPKIEGGAFSFHPALVLFLVVAGVSLAGIMGAILALPVTAMAWRTARYAFRRASGMPAGRATAVLVDDGIAAGSGDAGAAVPAPKATA